MPDVGIDITKIRTDLREYFVEKRQDFNIFGSTVNQVFEAFVFAATIRWYRAKGWETFFVHPKSSRLSVGTAATKLRLKFSTRGRPNNFTYAVCKQSSNQIQIRHQLRVATRTYRSAQKYPANICLDIAVIENEDLSSYGTDDAVPNDKLITFGEAKHMSAYAELAASFVGVVHELQPNRLKRIRTKKWQSSAHVSPFLYVSGFLFRTALGLHESFKRRGFDFDIFTRTEDLVPGVSLPPRAQIDVPESNAVQNASSENDQLQSATSVPNSSILGPEHFW